MQRKAIIVYTVLSETAFETQASNQGVGCSLRTDYVPPAREKVHRGSSLTFWLNRADGSLHDNEIIDGWKTLLLDCLASHIALFKKSEFMSIKTASAAFYSLCLKTWLSIQVQHFCRHMCVCVFSLETFCYFEKCFIQAPLHPLSCWLTLPSFSHVPTSLSLCI